MTDFVIKSTIALSIFFFFYRLILEREKMHQFNRFFLLFSIVISLIIPFVSFEIIKEIPVSFSNQVNTIPQTFYVEKVAEKAVEKIDYKYLFVSILYGIGVLALALRFGINIVKIISKTYTFPNVDFKNSKLVLVEEKILPHTFLHYIFINAEEYKKHNIEQELYTHELVHVTQKHTLDILFIEFLKIIFWFNPLFYFYKKAIQLNHEFLADQEIVKTYDNVPFYQNLLLQKGNGNQTIYLASNLNYLVTKKRLIMMTKRTSRSSAFIKKIAAIPVVVFATLFLCVETVAQEKTAVEKTKPVKEASTKNEYYSKTTVVFKDKKKNVVTKKKYTQLTDEEKKRVPPPPPVPARNTTTLEEFEGYKNNSKFAIWIDGVNVPNSKLDEYKAEDFVYCFNSFVHKNARSKNFPQEHQVTLYTESGYVKTFNKEKESDPETLIIIDNKNAPQKHVVTKAGFQNIVFEPSIFGN